MFTHVGPVGGIADNLCESLISWKFQWKSRLGEKHELKKHPQLSLQPGIFHVHSASLVVKIFGNRLGWIFKKEIIPISSATVWDATPTMFTSRSKTEKISDYIMTSVEQVLVLMLENIAIAFAQLAPIFSLQIQNYISIWGRLTTRTCHRTYYFICRTSAWDLHVILILAQNICTV